MTLVQLVKETRLLLAEIRRCAKYIADRKSNKSEKPPSASNN
jgi:hypothetical protein